MSLDKIPQIDLQVIETNIHDRYNSPGGFQRFKSQLREHLAKNPNLSYLIESLASQVENPQTLYRVAYTLIDVINAQLEVNELNEMSELGCGKERW